MINETSADHVTRTTAALHRKINQAALKRDGEGDEDVTKLD